MSVLGREEGYTVKYTPLPEGVPDREARGNSYNTGKNSPSCQTNMENKLFQYCPTRKYNTGSITLRNWECL